MHFRVKLQNGGYFWGLLKFQIFFPDIFSELTVDAGTEPTHE